MKKEEKWKDDFRSEFAIHFSPSELQFVLEFISDLLAEARLKQISKTRYKERQNLARLLRESLERPTLKGSIKNLLKLIDQ